MTEWQPIETAPKDGTAILTYRSGKIMAVAEWLQDRLAQSAMVKEGCWCVSDGMIIIGVTHWMPLPKPPKGRT